MRPTSNSPAGGALRNVTDDIAHRLHAGRSRHLRYLRSRLASSEDAEDALQDASLNLIQHHHSLATIDKLDAWIGVSLRHTVVDRYRRAAARRRLTEALVAQPTDSSEPDDDETLTAEVCLVATLPNLKTEYAMMLRQVYLEGVALKKIAEREQLTANNAAVRLHRARSALRQTMRHQCKTCPLDDCWARQHGGGQNIGPVGAPASLRLP